MPIYSVVRHHGGDDCSLDRSKPGERGKLLEELKAVLWAYLDAKLAAAG